MEQDPGCAIGMTEVQALICACAVSVAYGIFLAVLVILLLEGTAYGQSPQTFTSSGTFNNATGVQRLQVECWGGGGAGGGRNSLTEDGGSGGGGGAYTRVDSYTVTSGSMYTVTVGTKGTGTTGNGGAGNDSWFDSAANFLAKGGSGGLQGGASTPGASVNGGQSSAGLPSGASARFSGGASGAGRNNGNGTGGGGGSSAGTAADGGAGSTGGASGGAGGTAPAGGSDGASGGNTGASGNSAAAFGAAGGGSGSDGAGLVGGDGFDGKCVITWSTPPNIDQTTLPNGTNGSAYSQTVTATGCVSSCTYSVTSGALPDGLNLAAGGGITGTPTVTNTFNFTVRAIDTVFGFDDQALAITIDAAPAGPAIPVVMHHLLQMRSQ